MNFTKAIELLKDGVKITRLSWRGKMYIQMVKVESEPFKIRLFIKAVSNYNWSADMFLSNDWIVGNDDTITVTFAEAIEKIKQGYKVKLQEWKEMFLEYDNQSRNAVLHHWALHDYHPIFDDFCEDDWEKF